MPAMGPAATVLSAQPSPVSPRLALIYGLRPELLTRNPSGCPVSHPSCQVCHLSLFKAQALPFWVEFSWNPFTFLGARGGARIDKARPESPDPMMSPTFHLYQGEEMMKAVQTLLMSS